jgi:hypothetical protein
MVNGRPQICDYCAGEGTVPKLTPEQRAELIAKADAATRELMNAGKLEGSQLGNFARLLHRSAIDDAGDLIARPLELGAPAPFPEGVEVRPATDDEQRAALDQVKLEPYFKPFSVPADVLRQAEPFGAIDAMAEQAIGIDGKRYPRPPGFPVRGERCEHGADPGLICEKCVGESGQPIPNRVLLIQRMTELVADLVLEAVDAKLPAFDSEVLCHVINVRDLFRDFATDRSICWAEHSACACAKCCPE